MSTKFFTKKRETIAFGLALSCFVCVFFYALTLCFSKRVDWDVYFYFLTAEDERVEASAEFLKWEGGAGYLLSFDGEEYAAISVYSSEEQGESVRASLLASGKKTKLVKAGVKSLYFRGKERSKAGLYVSALKALREYMSVLSGCIDRLEQGMTQERCKELLSMLERQYAQAEKTYEGYPAFANVCKYTYGELSAAAKKTVYLKDLRYLLCWQAERYLEMCSRFA